jgi:hypothetical protein
VGLCVLLQPDPSKAEAFAERIQSYWPAVRADMLVADYCGIRPKVNVGGKTFGDFWIAASLLALKSVCCLTLLC